MQTVLEQGSIDKPLTFDVGLINSVSYQSVHLIHATFQSNCAEGLHFSAFHYYCCACNKTSISINKYMQKAREPENDAGFPKHKLNCSYSFPSKPRLQWLHFLDCTSMLSLSGC